MALTIKKSVLTVSVVADGALAIDLAAILGSNASIPVQGISYYPAAGANILTVTDGGAAEAVLWKTKCSGIATDQMGREIMFPGGKRCKPYVVGNEIANGDIITFHLF
jgi:hypothetical protein